MKALLIVLSILGVLTLFVVGSYVGASNDANEMEQGVLAQYSDVQNVSSNVTQKIMGTFQIASAYKDSVKEVATAAITGRYGTNGSQATWQFIKEQNPSVDPSLYVKVQQIIEAGRNDFQNAQSVLIDKRRAYDTQLGYVWRGFWMHLANYPTKKMDDVKIITLAETQEAFKSGTEQPLDFSPKSSKDVEKK